MEKQSEYQFCIDEIERYRSLREAAFATIQTLQKEQALRREKDPQADISDLQKQIDEQIDLDEKYGAKMHALAIRRNLLEE